MANHICVRCGVQYAATVRPPARCAICEDEREAVYWEGQRWTTLASLRHDHQNVIQPLERGLIGIRTEPRFAIGQQALLIQTPEGNVLWDCISLIDDATITAVRDAGELIAIASSHPHFYGALVEWGRAFGGIPIYLHAADRAWVMRQDPTIVFWEGARSEEHTSELQSRQYLVCRLLLEKKKMNYTYRISLHCSQYNAHTTCN